MKEEDITPTSMVLALKRAARIAAAMPDEVEIIRDLTIEHLKTGPKVTNEDGWAHLSEHLTHLVPAILSDPILSDLGARLNAENARIEEQEHQAQHVGVATALVAGGTAVAAYLLIVAAAGAYCTDGPYPEPGESLPAKCV